MKNEGHKMIKMVNKDGHITEGTRRHEQDRCC